VKPIRRWVAPTALVVIVPEASLALTAASAATGLKPPRRMPAHVTVLYPFLARGRLDGDTRKAVGELVTARSSFDFYLDGIGEFPGVSYLAPRPPEPFVDLTTALWARWPDHPPFGGAFKEVIPHLTLAEGSHDPAAVRRVVTGLAPIRSRATALSLMAPGWLGTWREIERFPLGLSA